MPYRTRQLPALLVGVALFAAACSGQASRDGGARDDTADGDDTVAAPTTPEPNASTPDPSEQPDCTPLADLPNGDVSGPPPTEEPFPWDRDDPEVREGFDPSEIISGGPPPDGIMPIDEPCFDEVETADAWLEPQSPVIVVEVDGDRRAYPLAIMTQHEIVNDVIGGEPVAVTYCPLCNSGLAFRRTVGGTVLDFGTSGRLFQSNLVMYDRQTRSLWTQLDGQAVVGEMVPAVLERVTAGLLGWEQFRDSTPDGLVLSRQVFPGRNYGRNPYVGYEDRGDKFLFEGPRDGRLPPNTRVVGLGDEQDAVAVPLPRLEEERVVRVEVAGEPVTVWWAPGQSSALDTGQIDEGREVGSTGAFVPSLPGSTELTFTAGPEDTFIDEETGSTWNILGEAIGGPLEGRQLETVSRVDTFWFSWFAFRSETRVAQ